jgi:hypothetical protein
MGAVKPPVRRSPKAGKLNAPEVKGEFGKGNEPLQDLRKLSTEVIVGLTEYPKVQRDKRSNRFRYEVFKRPSSVLTAGTRRTETELGKTRESGRL